MGGEGVVVVVDDGLHMRGGDGGEGAQRLHANLVLNVGPMRNGKLRPEDLELLSKVNLK